jgi:hypothetical protein
VEVLEFVDLEASVLDRFLSVASGVAAAEHSRPEGGIHELLYEGKSSGVGSYVFVEAQLGAGAKDAPYLGERRRGVGDGAENPGAHGGVEAHVFGGQCLGGAGNDADVDGGLSGFAPRQLPRCWIGLNRKHALNGPRIEGEVATFAAADFDHVAFEPCEKKPSMLLDDRIRSASLAPAKVTGQKGSGSGNPECVVGDLSCHNSLRLDEPSSGWPCVGITCVERPARVNHQDSCSRRGVPCRVCSTPCGIVKASPSPQADRNATSHCWCRGATLSDAGL